MVPFSYGWPLQSPPLLALRPQNFLPLRKGRAKNCKGSAAAWRPGESFCLSQVALWELCLLSSKRKCHTPRVPVTWVSWSAWLWQPKRFSFTFHKAVLWRKPPANNSFTMKLPQQLHLSLPHLAKNEMSQGVSRSHSHLYTWLCSKLRGFCCYCLFVGNKLIKEGICGEKQIDQSDRQTHWEILPAYSLTSDKNKDCWTWMGLGGSQNTKELNSWVCLRWFQSECINRGRQHLTGDYIHPWKPTQSNKPGVSSRLLHV